MHFYPKNRWANDFSLEGLDLFACLVDEMTFNYTIDTFKTPTMNTISLIQEAYETLRDVESGVINAKALPVLLEEVKSACNSDSIFQRSLEKLNLECYKNKLNDINDYGTYTTTLKILLQLSNLAPLYKEILKADLQQAICQNKKKDIETLTRIWVSILVYEGYSVSYIYHVNHNFFFRYRKIDSVEILAEYWKMFQHETKSFDIYILISKEIESFHSILSDMNMIIGEELPIDDISEIQKFRSRKTDGYVYVKMSVNSALGPYEAAMDCRNQLTFISQLYSFYYHRKKIKIHDTYLVREHSESPKYYCIKELVPNVVRCQDNEPDVAVDKFKDALMSLSLGHSSMIRVFKSMELHDNAVSANECVNQYINLFTAMEVLIPKDLKVDIVRIIQLYTTLIPCLSLYYFEGILTSLLNELKEWNRTYVEDVLSKVTEGETGVEKLAALLVLKKYDKDEMKCKENLPINDLYEKLTEDKYFLMRFRLNKLYSILSRPSNIFEHMEKHDLRIKNHMNRIYRTRNMIVHAGQQPKYIGSLIENLHSYYDTLITEILKENKNNGIKSTEVIYKKKSDQYEAYKLYLKSQSGTVTESNFLKCIFYRS